MDNGPGSKFQAALFEELDLTLQGQHSPLYSDDDLFNAFNGHLKPQAPTRATRRRIRLAAMAKQESTKMTLRRLAFGILGVLTIIIPLLVMAIPTASTRMLATAGISIAIFVFSTAIFTSASPESLLAASAAYAAVLVTLIGSN